MGCSLTKPDNVAACSHAKRDKPITLKVYWDTGEVFQDGILYHYYLQQIREKWAYNRFLVLFRKQFSPIVDWLARLL